MKRSSALVAVVALFVLGVVAGVLGTHLYYARQLSRPGGPPVMMRGFLVERLERELQLTPEQSHTIRSVLEESRHEADELRREMSPRVREVMERTSRRIEEVLTSEQREAYERLRRRQRHWVEHGMLGPPGPERDSRRFRRRPPPPPDP